MPSTIIFPGTNKHEEDALPATAKSYLFNRKEMNGVGKGNQVGPGSRTPGPHFWAIALKVLCERSCLNPMVYVTWFKPCSKYMAIGERN